MSRRHPHPGRRGPQQPNEEAPLVIESDLSSEMAVGHRELEAILRLLGGELDDILLEIGHN
jgi:hypothetical protein